MLLEGAGRLVDASILLLRISRACEDLLTNFTGLLQERLWHCFEENVSSYRVRECPINRLAGFHFYSCETTEPYLLALLGVAEATIDEVALGVEGIWRVKVFKLALSRLCALKQRGPEQTLK